MSYIYDVLLGHLREELDAGYGIDITNGVISATGVEAVGGVGISTAGGTISLAPASVADVISGSGSAAVVPSNLASALAVGKAVDVTSMPDGFTGSDWRAQFTWNGATLGFASFPKFAAGLSYILIADLTAEEAATVTPSGSWLSGGSAALSLPAGSTVRVAMAFATASTCLLTFSSGATVSVANLREYEVTALSDEARAYVAASPDAVNAYYLIDQDSVNPWTPYIDMGTSPAVTIQAGLAYKLNAQSGSHTLTVDSFPANSYGRDAHLELFVGSTGLVTFAPPLNLIDALTPNAVHNITVRFRDGQANAYVDDTDVGYVVTVAAGTASGSLYAALQSDSDYVVFANSIDGETVDLSGVVTAGRKTVVGNGYTETTLTGNVSCTSQTTFTNLAMSGVANLGGTMTLGNVQIPSGGTVSVSGGSLAVENVTGAGSSSVIDLGLSMIKFDDNKSGYLSHLTISGGSAGTQGAQLFTSGRSCYASANGVTFLGFESGGGYARCVALYGGTAALTECRLNTSGVQVYCNGGTLSLTDCDMATVSGNFAAVNLQNSSSYLNLNGSNHIGGNVRSFGKGGLITISNGAIVDLTGSPGNVFTEADSASIVVEGSCTLFDSGGTSHAIVGGTYSQFLNDGTTVPPQAEPAEE